MTGTCPGCGEERHLFPDGLCFGCGLDDEEPDFEDDPDDLFDDPDDFDDWFDPNN